MTVALAWARAFVLTCLVEAPIAVGLLRPAEPAVARALLTALFANLASHPLVWFVFPTLGLDQISWLVAAELWAVVSELASYRLVVTSLPWSRAALLSVLANTASLAVGLVLHYVGW